MDDFGCLGDKIALRTHHGKYVVVESNGDANADRKIALSYETFTVKELDLLQSDQVSRIHQLGGCFILSSFGLVGR